MRVCHYRRRRDQYYQTVIKHQTVTPPPHTRERIFVDGYHANRRLSAPTPMKTRAHLFASVWLLATSSLESAQNSDCCCRFAVPKS